MDIFDLIITIAILGVGSLLTGGLKIGKKTAPQQAAPKGGVADAVADEESDNTWEELFGSKESMEEASSLEGESLEGESLEGESLEEIPSGGYFTYESASNNESSASQTTGAAEKLSKPDVAVETTEAEEDNVHRPFFDLRQAVVSQAILQRVSA